MAIDQAGSRWVIASLILCLALIAVAAFVGGWAAKRQRDLLDAIDPDVCPSGQRFVGTGMQVWESPILDFNKKIAQAVEKSDIQACLEAKTALESQYPMFVARAYLTGLCFLAGNREREARVLFRRAQEMADRALQMRPGRSCLSLLQAFSTFYVEGPAAACQQLNRIGAATSVDGSPRIDGSVDAPLHTSITINCSDMPRAVAVLQSLGFQPSGWLP